MIPETAREPGPADRSDRQLGHFSLPERTIEHDLAIQERYQAFSAELLRISLLGLSVVGFAVSKVLFPDADGAPIDLGAGITLALVASLVGFGISAAAALIHRYSSVDSLSWHVQSLRRDLRGTPDDARLAGKEQQRRYRQFLRSRKALRVSASALGLSAAALAAVLILTLLQRPGPEGADDDATPAVASPADSTE